LVAGGGGGIRTHGTLSGSTVFKTVTFNRSDTPPDEDVGYLNILSLEALAVNVAKRKILLKYYMINNGFAQ
jgi:hypothetical protein